MSKSKVSKISITGYKGYSKDLKCQNDFQYEIDKSYSIPEGDVKICQKGFHFCENPLDVFTYYAPTNGNRFTKVTGSGNIQNHLDPQGHGDSKIASSNIKIGEELNLESMIEGGVKFIFEKSKVSKDSNTTTGDSAHSATTGEYAHSATTGEYAHSATTGVGANSSVGSANAIAAALGVNSKVKGVIGSWLGLTEWIYNEKENKWEVKDAKFIKVDGNKYKSDTWYMLKNGEVLEVLEV